ncbi:type II secretion system F family protein [Actinomycetes bacterium M1A6_2h]
MTVALLLCSMAVMSLPGHRRRLTTTTAARSVPHVPAGVVVILGSVACAAVAGIPVGVAVAAVGATLRLRRGRRRELRSRDDELNDLVTGLDTVIGELDVGAHPAAACESAAQECTVPTVFATAAARARLGGSAADAFTDDTGRCAVEIGRVGAVWSIAEAHGLALAVLLDAVRSDLLGRKRFARRTEASLAGARATAAVLAALPLVGVGLGQMMGASPLTVLLGGGLGGILLMVGAALVCAGLLWTDAITAKVTS